LVNKVDLLPYLEFDIEEAKRNILQVNPNISLFEISATKETGLEPWIEWLKEQMALKKST
jgi:hydrogenase nickel incorporation protein HypB